MGVLRHGRALVLGDVPEAEGELALRPEPLRAHLVGADARRHGEDAAVDRLLDDRGREVDVARREDDVRARSEQAGGARLGLRRVVVLGVAGLDLELPSSEGAALGVDLRDADLRGRQGGIVEGRHLALLVERPTDHDRLRGRGGMTAGGARKRRDRRSRCQDRCRSTPPRRSSHLALLLYRIDPARGVLKSLRLRRVNG